MVFGRSSAKVLTRCESAYFLYATTMTFCIQSTRARPWRSLQTVALICAAGLAVLRSPAESSPLGPEENKDVPLSSKPRTFDHRITMHQVDFGPRKVPDHEAKASLQDVFRQNSLAASFLESAPSASFSAPMMANQPDSLQGSNKKEKNWLTPRSNLYDLDAVENQPLFESGTGWGWLADSVMENQKKTKQITEETGKSLPEKLQELDSRLNSSFKTEQKGLEIFSKEKHQLRIRDLSGVNDRTIEANLNEHAHQSMSTTHSQKKLINFGKGLSSRANSSLGRKDQESLLHSQHTELNHPFLNNFYYSKRLSALNNGKSGPNTPYQYKADALKWTSARVGVRTAEKALTESRSVYSTEPSSHGHDIIQLSSPQPPHQSFAPLDDYQSQSDPSLNDRRLQPHGSPKGSRLRSNQALHDHWQQFYRAFDNRQR